MLVDEANAIGTTYLRAAMLPQPHGAKVRQLLRDYVDLRLGIRWREGFARKLERSEALHDALWKEAVACADELPGSLPVSLFITSLNDVIDLHTERVSAAVYRRLPNAIVATMFAVALLAMFVQGHSAGLSHGRATLATLAVTASVAAVPHPHHGPRSTAPVDVPRRPERTGGFAEDDESRAVVHGSQTTS